MKKKPGVIRCTKGCMYLATKTSEAPASFLLYGCRLFKQQFGLDIDIEQNALRDCKKFKAVYYKPAATWAELEVVQ